MSGLHTAETAFETAIETHFISNDYMTIASRAPNATASGLYPERSPAACAAR